MINYRKHQLPIEWERCHLSDVADFLDNKRIPLKEDDRKARNGPYPYYGASGIIDYIDDYIFDEELILLAEDGANILNRATPIAFKATGKYWVNNHAHVLRPKTNVDIDYLIYYLESLSYIQFNSGAAQPKLNREVCATIPVVLPSVFEQKAIADLLSTWDEAIEKTERLIQAKERQYRHLVRRLIHQQKSLSEAKLGDIATPITTKNTIGEANVLTSSAEHGLISQLEYYNKSVSADDVSGYYLLERGDFAYNRSSATGYPYGAIKRLDRYDRGVLSTLYICFRLTDTQKADSNYLVDLFEAGVLNRQLRGICQAGARSHGLLNVTKSDFFSLKIPLPSIETQKEIAEKLDLARTEIALLKELKEKYQTQKRGLMQKLLTGQWRTTTAMENESCV